MPCLCSNFSLSRSSESKSLQNHQHSKPPLPPFFLVKLEFNSIPVTIRLFPKVPFQVRCLPYDSHLAHWTCSLGCPSTGQNTVLISLTPSSPATDPTLGPCDNTCLASSSPAHLTLLPLFTDTLYCRAFIKFLTTLCTRGLFET